MKLAFKKLFVVVGAVLALASILAPGTAVLKWSVGILGLCVMVVGVIARPKESDDIRIYRSDRSDE